MDDSSNQKGTENDDGDMELSKDREIVSSDKETISNRRDESQIISDQDMTNEHDITKMDSHMGAITNSLEPIEDEPEDFIQGEVDVVTQMDRTTRAMEEIIDQSSGKKAHPKRDTFKANNP